jgi:hypothetical protein
MATVHKLRIGPADHGRKVTVLLRDGPAWVERVYQGEQPIESPLLPGFGVPVSDPWRDVEGDGDEPEADA